MTALAPHLGLITVTTHLNALEIRKGPPVSGSALSAEYAVPDAIPERLIKGRAISLCAGYVRKGAALKPSSHSTNRL